QVGGADLRTLTDPAGWRVQPASVPPHSGTTGAGTSVRPGASDDGLALPEDAALTGGHGGGRSGAATTVAVRGGAGRSARQRRMRRGAVIGTVAGCAAAVGLGMLAFTSMSEHAAGSGGVPVSDPPTRPSSRSLKATPSKVESRKSRVTVVPV